jgi:hypothetical protein
LRSRPSYFLLINACTDIGCGSGVLVGFRVGVALGPAGVADDALVGIDVRLGPGEVVRLPGSLVGSPTLHATMSSVAGSTPSTLM